MAMADTVYWLTIGGPVAEVGWLGQEVHCHLVPCCIHHVNRVNSHNGLP